MTKSLGIELHGDTRQELVNIKILFSHFWPFVPKLSAPASKPPAPHVEGLAVSAARKVYRKLTENLSVWGDIRKIGYPTAVT